jgi:HK97 family phage prohead protease
MSETRELPDNYRPALEDDVPEGRACGNCVFFDESDTRGDEARCTRWDEYVKGGYYCNAWQANERTNMSDLEFRVFDASVTEIRATEDGEGMTFGGYAWKYDSPSLPLPFTERIAPGAFTRSLKSRAEIRAYVNHDDTLLLGSRRAGTLRIDDRADGGWVEIDLPDTTWGRDIRTLVERGDIGAKGNGGMSFGFSTVKDDWSADGTERTLVEGKLWEVSVVTGTSAYMSSTASMVRKLRPLAERTATDVDDLSEAMTALQAGQLSEDQANLLRTVVEQVSPRSEIEPTTPTSILAAKLSLAEKALGL